MDIVRNADGTLVVPVEQARTARRPPTRTTERDDTRAPKHARPAPGRRRLRRGARRVGPAAEPRPGRPSRPRRVAKEAMRLVHAVAESPDHAVRPRSRRSTIPKRAARRCATCSSAASRRSRPSPPRSPRPRAANRSPRTRRRRSSARCSPSSTPNTRTTSRAAWVSPPACAVHRESLLQAGLVVLADGATGTNYFQMGLEAGRTAGALERRPSRTGAGTAPRLRRRRRRHHPHEHLRRQSSPPEAAPRRRPRVRAQPTSGRARR